VGKTTSTINLAISNRLERLRLSKGKG